MGFLWSYLQAVGVKPWFRQAKKLLMANLFVFYMISPFLLHSSECPAKNCHWPASTLKLLPCLSMDKIKDAWIPYSLSQTQKRHPTTLSPQQWSPNTFFLLRRFCDAQLRLVVRFETSSFGDPGRWRWLGFCSALQDRCRWPGRRGRVGGGTKWRVFWLFFHVHVDSKLSGWKFFYFIIQGLGALSGWRERSKVV